MKEQIFMAYETPQVELVEVEVEQGFAASNVPLPVEGWE